MINESNTRQTKRQTRTSQYLQRFIARETGTIAQHGTVTKRDKQGRETGERLYTFDPRPTYRPID